MSPVTAVKRAATEAYARLEREPRTAVRMRDMDTLRRVVESPTVLTLLARALGDGRATMRPPTSGSSVKPPPPRVVVVRHE